MLTPLEVFFVLLVIFIAFALAVGFLAVVGGYVAPSVLNNSACSDATASSVTTTSLRGGSGGGVSALVAAANSRRFGSIPASVKNAANSITSTGRSATTSATEGHAGPTILGTPIRGHSGSGDGTTHQQRRRNEGNNLSPVTQQQVMNVTAMEVNAARHRPLPVSTILQPSSSEMHGRPSYANPGVAVATTLGPDLTRSGAAATTIMPAYRTSQVSSSNSMPQNLVDLDSSDVLISPHNLPFNVNDRSTSVPVHMVVKDKMINSASGIETIQSSSSSLQLSSSHGATRTSGQPTWPASSAPHHSMSQVVPWRTFSRRMALLIDGDCTHSLKNAPMLDVLNMTKCAVQHFEIDPSDIYIVTASDVGQLTSSLAQSGVSHAQNIHIVSTSPSNVRDVMRAVVQRCKDNEEGTFVLFHYSGHGIVMPEQPDPRSAQPSTIQPPVGVQETGLQVGPGIYMTNAELYQLFVLRMPRRVRIFGLIDACHSGAAMSLPYAYDVSSDTWRTTDATNNSARSAVGSRVPECEVACVGASVVSELSNQVNGPIVGYGGALTVAFLESGQVIDSVDQPTHMIRMLTEKLRSIHQQPRLESNRPIV